MHELGASAANMAQHLVQPTAPSYYIQQPHFMPHTSINYFGRVVHGNGLNTRHPLQLLLKLTLSASLLHCLCCHVVLKHLALL
jgi:hypothetical protein